MLLKKYIMAQNFKVLGILPTGGRQEQERQELICSIDEIVRYNIEEADVWYQADSSELTNFYTRGMNWGYWDNPQYNRNKRSYFWAISATETDIKRTHSGMARNIIDTLVNLCGVPVVVNDDGLNKILEEINFWDLYSQKQMPMTLVEGWGAYKIDWEDGQIIVKYYLAKDVDFIEKNGKVIGIIFKDTYLHPNGKQYMVCETRYLKKGDLYSIKNVFEMGADDDLKMVKKIPNVDMNLETYKVPNIGCLLAEPTVFFKDYTNSNAYGRSVLTGKFDLLDDLDLCLSQSANTTRMSTPHEYINTDYMERDKNGMPIAPSCFDRRYTQYVGGRTSDGDPMSKEPVMVTQPKLDSLGYQTNAVNIQLQIVTGIISPATLGIDIAKKDNADAQREKEKVTIFTRTAILSKEARSLLHLFQQMLAVQAYLNGETTDEYGNPIIVNREYNISIKYGEFADNSYENKMSVLGEGYIKGVMSPEMYLDKLYGDTLSDEEYQRELDFLKKEKENPFGDMSNALGNEDNFASEGQEEIKANDF